MLESRLGLHSDTPEEVFLFCPDGWDALWDNQRCSGGSRALFASSGMQRFALPVRTRSCVLLHEKHKTCFDPNAQSPPE